MSGLRISVVQERQTALGRRIGYALLIAWAVVFLGGAIGEIFDVEFLRRATDLKRIFLR